MRCAYDRIPIRTSYTYVRCAVGVSSLDSNFEAVFDGFRIFPCTWCTNTKPAAAFTTAYLIEIHQLMWRARQPSRIRTIDALARKRSPPVWITRRVAPTVNRYDIVSHSRVCRRLCDTSQRNHKIHTYRHIVVPSRFERVVFAVMGEECNIV